jgi:hypothetical protein
VNFVHRLRLGHESYGETDVHGVLVDVVWRLLVHLNKATGVIIDLILEASASLELKRRSWVDGS